MLHHDLNPTLQVYDAGFYAAKIFMTWNRGIIVKLLYIHLGTLALENSQATKTLGCGEALREMMHILSHTDICS